MKTDLVNNLCYWLHIEVIIFWACGLNKIYYQINFTCLFFFHNGATRKFKITCVVCICGSHYISNEPYSSIYHFICHLRELNLSEGLCLFIFCTLYIVVFKPPIHMLRHELNVCGMNECLIHTVSKG